MPFINFINSIKNSFIAKRPDEQKMQTSHSQRSVHFERAKRATSQSLAKNLQQVEKESLTTRQTVINNSEGTSIPLIIRIPPHTPGDGDGQISHSGDADSRGFLFELILETENLGPVLLRLGGEGRFYNCSLYAESEKTATYLCQDFAEIRFLLADLLQRTRLGVTFLSLGDSLEKEHFIINTKV